MVDVSVPITMMGLRKVAGVERRAFFLNLGIAVGLSSMTQLPYLVLVALPGQIGLMWMTRKAPEFIPEYLRYRTHQDFYRPWTSPFGWRRNRRPHGFGRL